MASRDAVGQPGVALWDVEAGKVVKTLTHKAGVRSVAVSPDDRLLAGGYGDGTVKVSREG